MEKTNFERTYQIKVTGRSIGGGRQKLTFMEDYIEKMLLFYVKLLKLVHRGLKVEFTNY